MLYINVSHHLTVIGSQQPPQDFFLGPTTLLGHPWSPTKPPPHSLNHPTLTIPFSQPTHQYLVPTTH